MIDVMDTEAAARGWVEGWTRGWTGPDAALIAALYAADAVFVSQPFRAPADPRAYAEWAFTEEDEVECRFGDPRVSGDTAVVEYWAWIRFEGREQTLGGVALLRFDGDGKVTEQRDYWAMEDGRIDPPAGWGS
jgi:ketosteroid isomerase-like protein